MSSSQELSLCDPVTVTPSTSTEPLQGIVAHLGPVQFASDDEYVGIRLTGPSVGQGQNDGSVQGVRYFDCGASTTQHGMCGVFVKRHVVQRRELSRLEELRLKRELRSAGGTGSGGAASAAAAGSASGAKSPKPVAAARSPRPSA